MRKRMGKEAKRLLAFFMAMTLLIGIMPVSFAEAGAGDGEESGKVYEYLPGNTSDETTFTSVATNSSSALTNSYKSDVESISITRIRYDRLSNAVDSAGGHAQYNAFRLTGLTPGFYKLSFKNAAPNEYTQQVSAAPAVYFFKAEDNEYKTLEGTYKGTRASFLNEKQYVDLANDVLGYFNFAEVPIGEYTTFKDGDGEDIVLMVTEPGDYYIAFSYVPKTLELANYFRFYSTDTNNVPKTKAETEAAIEENFRQGANYWLECHIGGIKLTETDAGTSLANVDFSAENTAITPEETVNTTVSVKNPDGTDADLSKCDITYKSSDENIATVADDGKITGVAAGTAVISVSVKDEAGDELAKGSITVSVYDEPARIDIDFTKTVIMPVTQKPMTTPGYSIATGGASYEKLRDTKTRRNLLKIENGADDSATWPESKDGTLFEINADVPFDGNYGIQLRSGLWYAGAAYSVFVDGVYAGDINNWDGNSKEDNTALTTGDFKSLNTLYLTKGRHLVSFRLRKSNSEKGCLLLDTLSLIPRDEAATLSGISASLPDELTVGEIYSGSVSAKMSDGSVYHFGITDEGADNTANTLTAEASNGKVSMSDFKSYSIGNSGTSEVKLTGVELGDCELTFTAVVNGKTETLKKTVRVVEEHSAGAGEGEESGKVYEYLPGNTSDEMTFTSVATNSSSALTNSYKSDVESISITGIRYDRLSNAVDSTGGHAQYNAFRLTGLTPGFYKLSFKNAAPNEYTQQVSAAPAVYFFKAEDDEYKTLEGTYKGTRASFLNEKQYVDLANDVLGYFNFAEVPIGEYTTFKDGDGEDIVLMVTEPGDYYIAFSYVPKTLELANYFRFYSTDTNNVPKTKAETEAAIKENSRQGANYWLELHIGGIKLTETDAGTSLANVDFSAENTAITPEETVNTTVSVKNPDGTDADLSKCDITYKSSDENIATVADDGKITGVAAGTAVISVSVKDETGDELAKGSITVSVYDTPTRIDIDFTKTVIMPVTQKPMTTPGYSIATGGASYEKLRDTKTRRNLLKIENGADDSATWPESKDGTLFEINADVPFDGNYGIQLRNGLWYAGAAYSVFVDGVYAGDINNWDGNSKEDNAELTTGDFKSLNTLYLTKGRHLVSFRLRKSNFEKGCLLLDTLSLIPRDEAATLSGISASLPDELTVGEIYSGSVSAKMSDGSVYHFGIKDDGALDTVNTLTAEASNGKVSMSDFKSYSIGTSGTSEVKLTGVELGDCELTFTAVVNGETETLKKTVAVTDEYLSSTGAYLGSDYLGSDFLFVGDQAELVAEPRLQSGRLLTGEAVQTTYEIMTPETAEMDGNVIKAIADGHVKVKVVSTFRGKSVTGYLEFDAFTEVIDSFKATAGGSEFIRLTDKGREDTVPIWIEATGTSGNELELKNVEITAKALNPEYADTDGKNFIPVSVNEETEYADASFEITVKSSNAGEKTEVVTLRVIKGKSAASYLTKEMAEAARENYKNDEDIKKSVDSKYVEHADKYVDKLDQLYDMITSEGLPRGFSIGSVGDPEAYYCKYCMCDIRENYGNYSWDHDPFNRPWEIQCPDCKRLFPSNDFDEYYKLGLNEYGEFDRMRALENHRAMLLEKGLIDESVTSPGAEYSKSWKTYYGYGVKGGYLYNSKYEELQKEVPKTLNVGKGLRPGETAETWGVDDGMGYVPAADDGTLYKNGSVVERHMYIAEYLHSGIYRAMAGDGYIHRIVERSSYAYFYTGEKKYGILAAVLVDRIADFYWQYDLSLYGSKVENSHGGTNLGKIVGSIWENGSTSYAEAYDRVFDLYDDPEVLEYIRNKSKTIKMRHAKETPSQIRTNIEDGLLRTMLDGLVDCSISGNFGYPQVTNAKVAVILDTMPETGEWLDYLLAPGWSRMKPPSLGGGIEAELMKNVDADGQGNEGSDYNTDWHASLLPINAAIENYERYSAGNFFENPKFLQMFYSNIPLMSATYTPQIGDSQSTASTDYWMDKNVALSGWKNLKDPVFAQILYVLNGNTAEGLKYEDTVKNPERLEDEVKQVIEEYGTFKPESDIMTNFGFAALRDGDAFSDVVSTTASDTRRDVWMYFGSSAGHGHEDTLNLGMTAFGLNYMPDLGYPEQTGTQPNRLQWVGSTISHNTVMVDEKAMDGNSTDVAEIRGKVKHFDGDGNVQIMDVRTPYVYTTTDEYRRSVVYIKVDDANSYAVDFFRVLGGNDHLYSFHASSNQVKSTEGITLVPQADENGNYVGTYAGKDATYIQKTAADGTKTVRLPIPGETLAENEVELPVEYGPDPHSPNGANDWFYDTLYPRGYTWLKNVDRQAEYTDNFTIDFAIKDFNKAVKDSKGLGLRMTMLDAGNETDGVTTEVSVADGFAPNKAENKNIDKLKYVLVKKTNKNKELDTTFTTVFEPYKGENYIESISSLTLTPDKQPENGASARALKVLHKSGRCDYVFYSTDNSVMYSVTDGDKTLYFRGFVGVYTVNGNGNVLYSYVTDGDIIGETATPVENAFAAVRGKIKSFTDTLLEDPQTETNKIVLTDVNVASSFDLASLENKVIIVDNGEKTRSGSFKICGAEWAENGTDIVLDTGRISPVRSYVDANAPEKGCVCTIAAGQSFEIPMSYTVGKAPEFTALPQNATVSAESRIDVSVVAESPVEGVGIDSYYLETAPRGASIDSATGTISWKPDSSQVGDNHFAVTACDAEGRENTAHFIITVYGSTTGSSSNNANDSASSSGSDSAGTSTGTSGGGGGGGGGATDTSDTSDKEDNTDTSDQTGETAPDASGETDNIRFTDLGNHAWAADAINALADDGIVKGTTATTYSPAANITRADFAILLVRAFNLTSDNTENFADVSVSDYFAEELAIARNTGIVNGIGDNKYAPRNTITRQDMMAIVYRALSASLALKGGGPSNDGGGIQAPAEYPDWANVAPYARDAVSYLIANGIVNGKNGLIAPTDYTTRAEVAVLLKRILEHKASLA